MKKHLTKIMALILAVSMLATPAVMNVNAEESPEVSDAITERINATSTSDSTSDGHITVSCNYGTGNGSWEVGSYGERYITISWDDAVDSITKIKLHLSGANVFYGSYQAVGATLSNDNSTNFILSDFTGTSASFEGTSTSWNIVNIDYAEVTYTLKPLYTVTFDTNGHGAAPDSQSVYRGGVVDRIEDPTANGYTFVGWYKESGCINAWDFDNDTVNADTVLYAKWKKVSKKSDKEDNNESNNNAADDDSINESSDSNGEESQNEGTDTSAENATVTPEIQSTNVNGEQLDSWEDINAALADLDVSDLAAVKGTTDPMLQLDISGATKKVIPADTLSLADQVQELKYIHVFIGDGEAVTFDTNSKKVKNYKTTDFEHKDTVTDSTKTIKFITDKETGVPIMLHSTAPEKNTKYNIYYVDANGNKTLISIGNRSTGAGAICFPISRTGTYVLEKCD